jgi:hypothetical protein
VFCGYAHGVSPEMLARNHRIEELPPYRIPLFPGENNIGLDRGARLPTHKSRLSTGDPESQ